METAPVNRMNNQKSSYTVSNDYFVGGLTWQLAIAEKKRDQIHDLNDF